MTTNRRIVIAGTGSGVGKTTLTIGLMSALKSKGFNVQGFKCGPDYIDPSYHTAVTGRVSRNLDSWMLSPDHVKEVLKRGSTGADISLIEGVMGFYDGKDPRKNTGSTAEISQITESPVILVVNCQSMARSAAAIVKGFQVLDDNVNIVGVIANKVGSEGHYKLVKAAIEQECEIPVIGYLKRENDIEIPERHLGLIPSIERGELDSFFNQLGKLISESIDLDQLYELSKTTEMKVNESSLFKLRKNNNLRIAIAKDAAFNFYYQENIELIEAHGAECVYFSPLNGDKLPNDVDALYIGGGFPEEFAKELADQTEVNRSIKEAIESGLPTLAECGGFMYLADTLENTKGERYEMVGAIPGHVTMKNKRVALGYREITGFEGNYILPEESKAKGHEFHYSTFEVSGNHTPAYLTKGMRGLKEEGYMNYNLIAGYTHFHFASNPQMVDNWLSKCKERK